MSFISRLVSSAVAISTILLFVRFVVPKVAPCRVSGVGAETTTVCGNMILFKGDDILSIYRISLVNTPWRTK